MLYVNECILCGSLGPSLCHLVPTLLEIPSSSPQRKKTRGCPHTFQPDHAPTTHHHIHTISDILSKAPHIIENITTEDTVITAGMCVQNQGLFRGQQGELPPSKAICPSFEDRSPDVFAPPNPLPPPHPPTPTTHMCPPLGKF